MKFLLDTHTFIWCLFEPDRLSPRARQVILNMDNEVAVSAVSFWEISLKYRLGKLRLSGVKPDELTDIAVNSGFSLINLTAQEAAASHTLPRAAHRDPFDRMLIWQALSKQWTLISKDCAFNSYLDYGLKLFW